MPPLEAPRIQSPILSAIGYLASLVKGRLEADDPPPRYLRKFPEGPDFGRGGSLRSGSNHSRGKYVTMIALESPTAGFHPSARDDVILVKSGDGFCTVTVPCRPLRKHSEGRRASSTSTEISWGRTFTEAVEEGRTKEGHFPPEESTN